MTQEIFEVRCPKCGNPQQIATNKIGTWHKVKKYSYKKKAGEIKRTIKEVEEPVRIMKKCVYCEKRFCAYQHINNHQIIKRIK